MGVIQHCAPLDSCTGKRDQSWANVQVQMAVKAQLVISARDGHVKRGLAKSAYRASANHVFFINVCQQRQQEKQMISFGPASCGREREAEVVFPTAAFWMLPRGTTPPQCVRETCHLSLSLFLETNSSLEPSSPNQAGLVKEVYFASKKGQDGRAVICTVPEIHS